MKKFVIYTMMSLAGLVLLLTGLIGISHTSVGRPYLGATVQKFYAYLGSAGASCPLGFDQQMTLQQRDRQRSQFSQLGLKNPKAASRSLFEMQMGVSSRGEIMAWARNHGGACKNLKSPFEIECEGPFMGSSSSTLWLEFDGTDRLAASRGITKYSDAEFAGLFYQSMKDNLKPGSKNNIQESGITDLRQIKAGLLYQASVVAEFKDLKAVLRITNMGPDVAVTHEYFAF